MLSQPKHKVTSRTTQHFIYILQSSDGRYYIGYTTDLERRLKEHQIGLGGKFTKSFGAEKIVYHESFSDKSSALKREAQLKGWSRTKKEALIADDIFIHPLKRSVIPCNKLPLFPASFSSSPSSR